MPACAPSIILVVAVALSSFLVALGHGHRPAEMVRRPSPEVASMRMFDSDARTPTKRVELRIRRSAGPEKTTPFVNKWASYQWAPAVSRRGVLKLSSNLPPEA